MPRPLPPRETAPTARLYSSTRRARTAEQPSSSATSAVTLRTAEFALSCGATPLLRSQRASSAGNAVGLTTAHRSTLTSPMLWAAAPAIAARLHGSNALCSYLAHHPWGYGPSASAMLGGPVRIA